MAEQPAEQVYRLLQNCYPDTRFRREICNSRIAHAGLVCAEVCMYLYLRECLDTAMNVPATFSLAREMESGHIYTNSNYARLSILPFARPEKRLLDELESCVTQPLMQRLGGSLSSLVTSYLPHWMHLPLQVVHNSEKRSGQNAFEYMKQALAIYPWDHFNAGNRRYTPNEIAAIWLTTWADLDLFKCTQGYLCEPRYSGTNYPQAQVLFEHICRERAGGILAMFEVLRRNEHGNSLKFLHESVIPGAPRPKLRRTLYQASVKRLF